MPQVKRRGRPSLRTRVTQSALDAARENQPAKRRRGRPKKTGTVEERQEQARVREEVHEFLGISTEGMKFFRAFGDLAMSSEFMGFLTYYPIPEDSTAEQVTALYNKLAPIARPFCPKRLT